METTSLKEKYGYMFEELAKVGKAASVIDETNVYQQLKENLYITYLPTQLLIPPSFPE